MKTRKEVIGLNREDAHKYATVGMLKIITMANKNQESKLANELNSDMGVWDSALCKMRHGKSGVVDF